MKRMSIGKYKVLSAAVLLAFLTTGCMQATGSNAQKMSQQYSEEELGLRDTALLNEDTTKPVAPQYSKSYAGSGKMYKRAFQDAPPMIPHSVEGMVPVKINNNQCISCHMPNVAPAVNATAIPESHFLDMRPKHQYDGKQFKKAVDNMKNETSVQKAGDLSGARFNCTQCHASQSETEVAKPNNFKPEFTSQDGDKKSSWSGTKLYEGLDTIVE